MSRERGLPQKKRMRHDSHFVEELTAPRVESIGRLIDLRRIEPNPHQPRKSFGNLQEHHLFTTGNGNWLVRVDHCRRVPAGREIISATAPSTFIFESNLVSQDAAIMGTGSPQIRERWNVVSGTGILLNNEMDDFSSKPGVPNAYGLIGGKANAIEGAKRPLSSMTPSVVNVILPS